MAPSAPCLACPRVNQCLDRETTALSLHAHLLSDGSLDYQQIRPLYAGGFTLNREWINRDQAKEDNPNLAKRFEDCSGPIEVQQQVKRRGLLGRLGLTKTVQVADCPAVTPDEMLEAVIISGDIQVAPNALP